jgi:hypothetical protein
MRHEQTFQSKQYVAHHQKEKGESAMHLSGLDAFPLRQ